MNQIKLSPAQRDAVATVLKKDLTIPENTTKWDNSIMKVNTPHDVIEANIRTNIQRQLPQLCSFPDNPKHIVLVGGGWTLNVPEIEEELRQLWFKGSPFVALNNSAKWLMERNLKPAMHFLMDARKENVEFTETIVPNCKYYVASQCAPEMFDALAGRDVTMFHPTSGDEDTSRDILDKYYNERWVKVPSAATIGLVSLLVLRTLGFRFIHLFGIDSCYPHDRKSYHHAYDQKINDDEGAALFSCAGRDFACSAWQAAQATSFVRIVEQYKDLFSLSVHGDGLLAHMLKTGAELSKKKE